MVFPVELKPYSGFAHVSWNAAMVLAIGRTERNPRQRAANGGSTRRVVVFLYPPRHQLGDIGLVEHFEQTRFSHTLSFSCSRRPRVSNCELKKLCENPQLSSFSVHAELGLLFVTDSRPTSMETKQRVAVTVTVTDADVDAAIAAVRDCACGARLTTPSRKLASRHIASQRHQRWLARDPGGRQHRAKVRQQLIRRTEAARVEALRVQHEHQELAARMHCSPVLAAQLLKLFIES